ncbi:spirocyclase AveC family protein [Mycobacterium sp. CVI_P3]|uniref:Spirocyclase AveC family protein n=1 Tax=Mycobacterium pinniadriaticum TaxID=2994102 RepID=A0ABT3SPF7_9MYCO|nr:spirocyclase AveC family protein [Mycobacterium pinniadriaticum]MCX2934290.1 spirocyclase AveC family protein [Mycobacterium pinniadriaticum]MCX2940672.1 spirocyclase AveC family protein [Mycobacterium pinniadriaticum]
MTQVDRTGLSAPGRPPQLDTSQPKATLPVQVWATIGGLVLAFIVVIWTKWVMGPYFTPVPSGPSRQPTWMTNLQFVWQIAFTGIALWFLYWFLVRPWRRDGRPSTDGLLCVAIALLFFQDPLSSFTGHWFTYNMNLFQYGSWVNEIPGWMAYGAPGANVGEPLVFTGAVYIWAFFGMTLIGCWIMRMVSRRWPRLSKPSLIAICFSTLFVADVILEGFIWLPLGFLTYPGGHWNLFAGSWHQYPVHEAIFAGALFTGLACLRYFVNDRGETIADRGLEKLKAGSGVKTTLKFLAFIGVTQAIMMVTYNIPVAVLIAANPAEWPKSIQERSYFTDGVCGAGTTRLCPQPGVPTVGVGDVEIGPGGRSNVPAGVSVPTSFVPFVDTPTG